MADRDAEGPPDTQPGAWVRLDFLREHLVPMLEADGLAYLHCPDWSCGQFTILPSDGAHWVCPTHGGPGVKP